MIVILGYGRVPCRCLESLGGGIGWLFGLGCFEGTERELGVGSDGAELPPSSPTSSLGELGGRHKAVGRVSWG